MTTDAGSLRARFRGALMGVAVGDALGAPFEGAIRVTPEQWEQVAEGAGYLRFTDDTHMTFGVAESLLAHPDFDGDHMAAVFVRDFDAEPWRGYGPGPPQVFQHIRAGLPWDEAGRAMFGGEGSFGNGGAMRVAPVALAHVFDLVRVRTIARRSASITHAHELGMEGAAAQACALALALRWPDGEKFDRDAFLESLLDQVHDQAFVDAFKAVRALGDAAYPSEVASGVGNGTAALEAVPASLAAFLARPSSFPDAVAFAVALGGDTDTIASMTGALSGGLLGQEAIPETWTERVEGAPSMARVADQLFTLAMARSESGSNHS